MSTENTAELVAGTLDRISRKWHPVIVQRLLETGPLGFNELQATVDGISAKVLTDSVADLVEHGLVERTIVSETPLRVEYELTDRGRDLQTPLQALAEWGEQHLSETPDPLVFVVDDDPRIVSMYEDWLNGQFRLDRAFNGEEAMRRITDNVDVVLLDRHMPGVSGDEVAARIDEMGVNVGVVLLTAAEPGFDVIDVPFDEYLEKPGEKGDLISIVEDVRGRSRYVPEKRELLSLQTKRTLLQGTKTSDDVTENGHFDRLEARIDRLESVLEDSAELDPPRAGGEVTDGC